MPTGIRLPGPDAKPCKNGNIAPRRASDYGCLCAECKHARQEKKRVKYHTDPAARARQIKANVERRGRARAADPRKELLAAARARARARVLPFDLTIDDITLPAHCPVLGIPIAVGHGKLSNNSPTLDRIVPQLGYVRGNVAVISYKANAIKRDASPEELQRVATWASRVRGVLA